MKHDGAFPTLLDLDASLASRGVSGADRQMLLKLAKPAMAFPSTVMEDSNIPTGTSKIGGAPDMPRGMGWPFREATEVGMREVAQLRKMLAENPSDYLEGELSLKAPLASAAAPLTFMAQVDLVACAATGGDMDPDIPTEGIFLLFYDLVFRPWYGHESSGNAVFRLLHVTAEKTMLVRREPPEIGYPLFGSMEEFKDRLPSALLDPVPTYTLPDSGSSPFLLHYDITKPLPHDEWLDSDRFSLGSAIQLGGWPENIQGDMAIELAADDAGIELPYGDAFLPAARAIEPLAEQWVHLIQLGDYDTPYNDFDGLYHVWIKREDLRRRDFTKARLVYRTT
ncbi:DUF1963 domain-containing protein [Paracoccus saliphilus]|uniref:DUF1963 domain-containing protein n=1 Tax=Paracoccus saliphilus TaxID=405559 RepID=A0AA45W2S2_9RHOB|nr:DUF1963 domain-containing protein [Paracoccus saliphilus]WCR01390.1 DUF1963 domain-containing protein [Paracoccus saliphilus]SIS70119.1 protein of unknown function [Paracoccus saliphilus]